MERNNPRGYMELIRSIRDGNFDKAITDDKSIWHSHVSNLLAKKVDPDMKRAYSRSKGIDK
jgi:hypothetical protein